MQIHTARAGETVYSIARLYGLSPRQLYQNNFFLGGYSTLSVGDVLVIAYNDEPERTVDVSAYAAFLEPRHRAQNIFLYSRRSVFYNRVQRTNRAA